MSDQRQEIVEVLRALWRQGLIQGSSGNVSARTEAGMLISGSGVRPEEFGVRDVVEVGHDGGHDPDRRPSTEWRMHMAIYRARADVGAVIHTHSPHATALSCLRQDLPAFHYMVGFAGGDSIRCARHATVASPELAEAAIEALDGRTACLLANHGTIAAAADLRSALHVSEELEQLARVYCIARSAGDPVLLGTREMDEVLEAFTRYRS